MQTVHIGHFMVIIRSIKAWGGGWNHISESPACSGRALQSVRPAFDYAGLSLLAR
jgi:hypothetical protein